MSTLQILHLSDPEGGVEAIDNAPNAATVVDSLRGEAADGGFASVLVSGGDNYLPGPFFNAGGDGELEDTFEGFYNAFFGLIDVDLLAGVAAADSDGDGFFDNDEIEELIDAGTVSFTEVYIVDVDGDGSPDYFENLGAASGRLDIAILNELGLAASAVGNHEFDAGTGAFRDIVAFASESGDELEPGRFGTTNYLELVDTPGAQFPYLAANLDFSGDGELADIAVDDILTGAAFESDLSEARVDPDDPFEVGEGEPAPKLAPAVILDADGDEVGVVGATTQLVASISSTGGVSETSASGTEDMQALADVLQPVVDDLTGQGVDKIVLVSHLQQIALETELAGLLQDVDVIVAGGSDTILADATDRLRPGDEAVDGYPREVTNAGGEPTLIVSTDGTYNYVGRLVVDFDDDGVVDPSSVDAEVSGAFATDEEGVLAVTGAASLEDAIANSETAQTVADLATTVEGIVTELDGDIAGETAVFLEGRREAVRTEETNLGNLTADANLAAAQASSPDVAVSLKNGGGIRAPIGEIVDLGGGEVDLVPPQANPLADKEEGEISELDIDNALRFDNALVTVELTPEELEIILEHGVAATAEGATPGQFPQVGGLTFSFDPAATAQQISFDDDNPADFEVRVEGERIQNVALLNDDGTPGRTIIEDGEVVPGAPATIEVVTLGFLAGGGDGYPFLAFSDSTDLGIGEQQALSDFLRANFPEDGGDAFDRPETPPEEDERIQNLAVRGDSIGDTDGGGKPGETPTPAPMATGDLGFAVAAEFVGAVEGDDPEGASEVVAQVDGRLYVTNGNVGLIEIFELDGAGTAPGGRSADASIDLTELEGFGGVQSVAVADSLVAAAIARPADEAAVFGEDVLLAQPGFVALFDAETLALLGRFDVGVLPDQLTFTPDGDTLLVAGEGEFNAESEVANNTLGTLAIADVTDPSAPSVEIVDFSLFTGLEDQARADGLRIFENVGFAVDVEPEYIAVAPDGERAFVSLQEANTIAELDIRAGEFVDFFPLGTVDFSEGALDPTPDGDIDIQSVDGLVGLRQADALASYAVGDETFIVTADEGDGRGDYFERNDDDEIVGINAFGDTTEVAELRANAGRFGAVTLDPELIRSLADQGLIDDDPQSEIGVEVLEISALDGDTDGDGDIDVLHAFGGRSFSIFDDEGNLVFTSGPAFERIVADLAPARFNDDEGGPDENRSDDAGPEPEAVDVAEIDGRTYAFIGLERDSGIVIYDVTTPAGAFFVDYIPPVFFDAAGPDQVARVGPEIVEFIPAEDGSTGNPQLAAAYEISGTTVVFDLIPPTPIGTIQGAAHTSPLLGQTVTAEGIVTAVDTNGFYLQDPVGDGDERTSDAVFVFTGAAPTVTVGDKARVQGTVGEFTPGGAETGNLSTTQIGSVTDITVLAGDQKLPEATVIGADGRVPPTEEIDDDAFVSFEPSEDGIDFFESLEAMRVTGRDLVAVAPTNRFGEIFTIAEGAGDAGLSDRGTLNIGPDDFNPEKVQVDEDSGIFDFDFPEVDVGTRLGDVTGVIGYSFGNFEILPTEDFTSQIVPSSLEPESTDIGGDARMLTVASYNVLNLDPVVEEVANVVDNDPGEIDDDVGDGRFAAIAEQVVDNLASPAIIALQEIQDNDGAEVSEVTAADETLQTLVDAIGDAGGPVYEFIDTPDVPPTFLDDEGEVDSPVGGQPGGNIRNAFLYDPARVDLVDGSMRTLSDGDDDPFPFFEGRIPLVATFAVDGAEVTLVNNHLSSKGGSAPILGVEQPFDERQEDPDVNGSLQQRRDQAQAVRDFVEDLIVDDPGANIVVLGDLNEFEFVSPVLGLAGTGFSNLTNDLPADERYSFIFQGNSQSLDHIIVSEALAEDSLFDIVHVNAEFAETAERASDHEPLVAGLDLGGDDPAVAAADDVLI